MHLPRKNLFVFNFFSRYLSYIIKKDFSKYSFNSISTDSNRAILLLANRFSWWDGFLLFHLNKVLFKKKFYILIEERDYLKHTFFKYLGAFAPENNSKDLLETFNYAGQLLDDPDNLLLIFPQGKLQSGYLSAVNFEKGIIQIINSSKKSFQTIFAATLVDHSKRKPAIRTFSYSWEAGEYLSLQLIKSEYKKHYEASVKRQSTEI